MVSGYWEINCIFTIFNFLITDLDKRLMREFATRKLYFSLQKESSPESASDPEIDAETVEFYRYQKDLRKNALRTLNDTDGWVVLYSVLVPEVSCKNMIRLGTVSDGGKWVCNPVQINDFDTCTVYSLGVKDEPSFEEEFAKFTNNKCFIRSIDKDSQNSETIKRIKNSNGIFMRAIVTSETNISTSYYDMRSLMEVFNDKKIDILKIDIEGFEYIVIDELTTLPVCQILIEIHGTTPTKTLELLRKISRSGYYLFSHELNGGFSTLSEYGFIHQSCLKDYGVNVILGRYLS